ncbi:fibronectin type III domain-containing protein [Fodinicola acaciae]|uniref:fibronectin type III domain-containing protein n=1 Tax=Fodinicola acaciae TaxID=2681555 RepID=UPI0013D2A8AC|nr:fibronectin type III domain-containing protein [Fodinicola acaciae]
MSGAKLVASSARKSRLSGRPWPLVAALTASVAMVAAAASGASSPGSDMRFHPSGHWVYNSALQTAFHIDGATTNIDARVPVAGEPGSQVVQDDTNGYVVGRSRITRFGKSNLRVQGSLPTPSDETPLAIEAAGGPYLVYRQAGKIVRLGENTTVVTVGERIGDPVVTGDGTLWLLRRKSGLVCTLAKGSTATSTCPARLPAGHSGALTTVGDKPQVLDTTAGLLHAVSTQGLGAGKPVGVEVSADTRVAPTDSGGRLALLDPSTGRLSFVDTQAKRPPVNIELGKGDFEGPLWTDSTVVVVNRTTGTLQTYDAQGHARTNRKIPPSEGQPSIARGADGRVYVQNGAGTHLLIVDEDGQVADTPVSGGPEPSGAPSPSPSQPAKTPTRHEAPPPTAGLPASAPGAPQSVTASAGNRAATVSWQAAAANRAAVTGYVVSWPGGSRVVSGAARHATISGLTNGQSYTFSVSARNSAGEGPAASADPVTPRGAAAAPRGVTASVSGGAVTVRWQQPDLGGGTLRHYAISATGQASRTVTGTSATYSGLANGRYTFTVRAVTSSGGQTLTGAAGSAAVTVTGPTIHIERRPEAGAPNCTTCFYLYMTFTDFPANTSFDAQIFAEATGGDYDSPCHVKTDASGSAICDRDTRDGVPKGNVYVYVNLPDGRRITSNEIYWS